MLKRLEVLAIDDEPLVLRMIERFLPSDRYAVFVSTGGAEGLAQFRTHNFQVAIVDLRLPDQDGLEIVRLIRRRHPLCVTIVLTGHATVEVAQELVREGCDDLLLKPLQDPSQLDYAISRAMQRRRLLRGVESLYQIGDSRQVVLSLIGGSVRESADRCEQLVSELRRLGTFAASGELEPLCSALQNDLHSLVGLTDCSAPDLGEAEAEYFYG